MNYHDEYPQDIHLDIADGRLRIENVRPFDREKEPHNFIGFTTIAGCDFHVVFIEVLPVYARDGGTQLPTHDPCDRFDALCEHIEPDAPFYTVHVPELSGRSRSAKYIMYMYPFCT